MANEARDRIEIHRPELHGSGFRAILEVAESTLGRAKLDQILAELGVSREVMDDAGGWFSLAFAEALMDRLVRESGDPALLDRAIRLAVSPKHLGILAPLFRSFGTPSFLYRQATSLLPRLNKVTTWSVELVDPQRVRITVRRREGAPAESTPHFCRVRTVQLAEMTSLFDLPLAEVRHPACMLLGKDACIYDVSWKERRRPLRSIAGFFLGATTGFALGIVGGLPFWLTAAIILGLALGGWALGRTQELGSDLQSRVAELNESHDALVTSTRANEERYAELLEAKSEVDAKVERRTHELKDASDRLSETLDEIQALDRAKTDFFNNVSHELRSPLTLILAPLADLVAGREPAGGSPSAFATMHSNASRLLRLINQLLDLAKIDAGQMRIALTPVDAMSIARSALTGFEAAATKKRIAIVLSGAEGMPPIALDPPLIESAITNLVANALRLSPEGGAVRVRVEDLGSEVTISVADDGPGIALEDQPKIFERFAQGDSAKRVIGGTGIGLALVREAVRLHGGDVSLVSELGKGAQFTLTVPRRAESQMERTQQDAPLELARSAFDDVDAHADGLERSGPAPNAPLALVVEDNPELRVFVANVLAVRYRVRAVSDGAQALALLPSLRPDVVVSDVAMPVMDGYALCRRLRADPQTSSIPVLLVTARTEEGSVLAGFEAGASDYVLKPFHGRELLARVDAHVRLRRMAQELVLRERHAMLGVLAASVAHQVRNPLTTLVSGLPAMRARLDGRVSQSTFELIDMMMDCASRIERLTGDLVDLSRVDREEGGDFRPSDGLQSAIRMVRARVPDNVVIDDHVETSPIIQGRPGDVNHVFMNVLDNAVRAVAAGGKVTVDAALGAEAYVVRIADDGPGVEPSVAERIFEPFFTTRPAGEGTGLGLAIAQQVMQQCGGSIRVGRSHLGGAEFVIEMPLVGRIAPESGLVTTAREALH